MWRGIIGLDEGPGDDNGYLSQAVDNSVLRNVITTTDPLRHDERLAIFTGFVQWAMGV